MNAIMPDRFQYSLLLDIYGELLTESSKDLLDLSCNQDLSLSEIADLRGISRQAVSDGIRRAERHLRRYEETLGMAEVFLATTEQLDKLDAALVKRDIIAAQEAARALRVLAD